MIICPRERFAGAFCYICRMMLRRIICIALIALTASSCAVLRGLTTAEPAFIPELFEELANVWPE